MQIVLYRSDSKMRWHGQPMCFLPVNGVDQIEANYESKDYDLIHLIK